MIDKGKLFRKAWRMAKKASEETGEKASKFFREALKIAWEEIKIENAPLKSYELKIKKWLYDKVEKESTKYWTWIAFSRRTSLGKAVTVDGYVFVIVKEVLEETEKAIKVRLDSGECGVGSVHGWTTWLPKSQIIRTA